MFITEPTNIPLVYTIKDLSSVHTAWKHTPLLFSISLFPEVFSIPSRNCMVTLSLEISSRPVICHGFSSFKSLLIDCHFLQDFSKDVNWPPRKERDSPYCVKTSSSTFEVMDRVCKSFKLQFSGCHIQTPAIYPDCSLFLSSMKPLFIFGGNVLDLISNFTVVQVVLFEPGLVEEIFHWIDN